MDTGIDPSLVLKITAPKLRRSLLVRDRLRQIPRDDAEASVVLVEAPAGHGKTSLLAQWRLDWAQSGAAVAWLNLDQNDTPVTFVSGIVHGLRRAKAQPSFGLDAIEAVRRGADPTSALTSLLAGITETAVPIVLVFDNFERLQGEALLDLFGYLLHNLPPNLRLALGSRPPAPLRAVDLLSTGQLRRITPDILRFDLAETMRFFSARFGDRVSADTCARLHEATDGWPLALQIVATALDQSADPAAAAALFVASRDDTMRGLFDAMLAALPPGLTAFATRCALLDVLHPGLCEAVTGEELAGLFLQQILVDTPLLSATEDGEWVRFHPLAREYLRARAERSLTEDQRRELHLRASEWLAAHGMHSAAAQHALAAGRRQDALSLIAESLYAEFLRGNAGTVNEWLARIPTESMGGNAALRSTAMWMRTLDYRTAKGALPDALALAEDRSADDWLRSEAVLAAAVAHGYFDELHECHALVVRYPSGTPDSVGRRIWSNVSAGLEIFQGATEKGRQILFRVPHDDMAPQVTVWNDFFVGLSYLWDGRPLLAEQALGVQHSRWEAAVGRRGHWASMIGSLLAVARWQRDFCEEARILLANRLDVIEQCTLPEGVVLAYRTLARMSASEGDEARAFVCLESLASLGDDRSLHRFSVGSLAEQVRLHAAGHRPTQAAELLSQLDVRLATAPGCRRLAPLLRLEQAMAQSFAAWAGGELAAMAAALDSAAEQATRMNRGYEAVQILGLRALLTERGGGSPDSLLTEALSRASIGDLVRVFADSLPDVVQLIRRRADAGALAAVSGEFIGRVVAAATIESASRPRTGAAAGNAILTPKEQAVLELLAAGMPNKRIATELGLAGDTVKWHVKKLFAKLNAGSREHAVARARMLGLLT